MKLKELFLKPNLFNNFFSSIVLAWWGYDPFFFNIVVAVYNGNDGSSEFCQWYLGTKNIDILFFAIWCEDARDIAIVDGVI